MRTLEFRDVKDGDAIPFRHGPSQNPHKYWPLVLRWFCPSLSEADALEVYDLCRGSPFPVTVASLRRRITEWAVAK